MYNVKNFVKEEMTTMVELTNSLLAEGYRENFMIGKNGMEAPTIKKIYSPKEVKINSFYRFEGESDPADNSIMYAIETKDGLKGLLVDAYGTYADPEVAKFIKEVEKIRKRPHTHDLTALLAGLLNGLYPPARRELPKVPLKFPLKQASFKASKKINLHGI